MGKVARSTIDGLDMPPGAETSGFSAKAMFGYLADATLSSDAKAVAHFYTLASRSSAQIVSKT